ncbi:MAG: PEP-CTERM sorting domain-containing protein, partial [Gammaproteobacteria bacterium]|nr:PEP-CTERM sorting domain-containing protein [Gammaproteobacteria bacterium]
MYQIIKSILRIQAVLLAAVFASTTALASTYGTLSNFDVVNDTDKEGHGFEIELEGISVDQVTYTFGGSYIRYGTPSVVPNASGSGVIVRYASTYSNGKFSATTPIAPVAISP